MGWTAVASSSDKTRFGSMEVGSVACGLLTSVIHLSTFIHAFYVACIMDLYELRFFWVLGYNWVQVRRHTQAPCCNSTNTKIYLSSTKSASRTDHES